MDSITFKVASKVYRKNVSRLEVARYYLKTEMSNIITPSGSGMSHDINQSIESLSDVQVWRLLEAMSYTYRMNGLFHLITNRAFDWVEVELPISVIALNGMTPAVNKVVYSKQINCDVTKFCDYLKRYFLAHPEGGNDPEGLGELRPRGGDITHSKLMTIERQGKVTITDGMHRLLEYAQSGTQFVRVYAGVRNGKAAKHMVGDSTFLTMRHLYAKYRADEQREQILDVTAMLAKSSTDGRKAVKTYWVEHVQTKKKKGAGLNLLNKINSKDSEKSNNNSELNPL